MTPTFRYALGVGLVLATVGMHLANASALDSSRVGNAVRPTADTLDGYVFAPPSADDAPGAAIAPTCAERPDCASLASYAARAAFEWVPMKSFTAWGETEAEARARVGAILDGFASVAIDPAEPPLFDGPGARERTALWMVSLSSDETGFARYSSDGPCNDPAWRRAEDGRRTMTRGDCDHGVAFGPAQMHVDEQAGVLTATGWCPRWQCPAGPFVKGADTVRDRELGARVMLHWLRTRPEVWGSASYHRRRAEAWFAKHPPPTL